MKTNSLSALAFSLLVAAPAYSQTIPPGNHRETVLKTAGMATNEAARALAAQHGLDILSLTWEDTGRFKNSAVGPNISDMTIQVAVDAPGSDGKSVHCMPVIRFPNFSDKTADLDPKKFRLLVGNENGSPLRSITLYEFLDNPTLYLTTPGSWSGEGRRSLLAPARDARVLVSAQACFLPVPLEGGKATFNPVLFNYQSMAKDPAVLTVLVTREGTSVTIIDNQRDAFAEGSAWGQRLFFNHKGQRASLTGERQSTFQGTTPPPGKSAEASAAGESGMNLVMLIQIPLKQRNPMRPMKGDGGGFAFSETAVPTAAAPSDVENAVIGHGEFEGPFTEIDRLPIQRDPDFPVRVTVQFYKATSNGVVSENDLKEIKAQIDRVYDQGDSIGSLVTDGDTGRATEYDGPKVEPADWWEQFWKRHEKNTGDTREEAMRKLRKLLGDDYLTRPVNDAYLKALLSSTPLPEGIAPPETGKKGLIEKLFKN